MVFRQNGNKLILTHDLKEHETFKFNKTSKGQFLSIYNEPVWTHGMTSMCEDGKHVLFLDYDSVAQWVVELDLEALVKQGIAPFYLFCTKKEVVGGVEVGNFHAVCPRKFFPNSIVQIQQETHCDNAYVTMPLRNVFRSWVLRTSNKGARSQPKFLKVVGKTSALNEVSTAHLRLLEKLYSVPTLGYTNQDGLKGIRMNAYETLSRVD